MSLWLHYLYTCHNIYVFHAGHNASLFTLVLQGGRCLFFSFNLVHLKAISVSVLLYLLLRDSVLSSQNWIRPEPSVGNHYHLIHETLFWISQSGLWESPQSVLGSVQSADEKERQSYLFSQTPEMPRPFSLLDMMGVKSATTNFLLCNMNWSSVICALCWPQMNKIDLRNLETIKERRRGPFKPFLCKIAGFLSFVIC